MRLFAYRLALALGRADVDALLSELTWPQLREWIAYYELDPWGGPRGDLQAGIIASTMANIHRGRKAPLRPRDFMPQFGRRAQTQDEMVAVLTLAAQAAQRAKRWRR